MKYVGAFALLVIMSSCVVQSEPLEGQTGPQGPPGSEGQQGDPGNDAVGIWSECGPGTCFEGGPVGIGNTDPRAVLHVTDFSGSRPSAILFESGGTANSTFRFEIPTPSYGGLSAAVSINAAGPAGQAYSFLRATSDGVDESGIPRFELYSSGSVGVGLNFPGATPIFKTFAKAHDPSNVPSNLCLGLDDGGGTVGMCIVDSRNANDTYNDQHIEFSTHKGGVGSGTRMVITPLGYVGIGTAEPTAALHVTSESTGPAVQISNTGTGYALAVGSNGVVTAGTAILGTDSNAKVGIRTTTPKATLDVNGTARLAKYAAEPHPCTPEYDGTIALTGQRKLCVCDGSAWVLAAKDAPTPCW